VVRGLRAVRPLYEEEDRRVIPLVDAGNGARNVAATRRAPGDVRTVSVSEPFAVRADGEKPVRSPIVAAIALVTLGSGILNLYSLTHPAVSERLAMLFKVFPLEFITLSRFLLLVLGFALVVSSLNILKRKRRALQVVIVLASLSAVLHLTKGVDYKEATLSLVLIALLVAGRHHFTVRSRPLDLRPAGQRLGVTLVIGLLYGLAGFWLLDPREFGINFTWRDAIHQTWLYLTLSGDPRLVPHTRHAAWFLQSLSLMTTVMVVYALTLLFRPALYRLRTVPHDRNTATDIVAHYGRSSLDFFKLWPDKSYFFLPSNRAFLAYSVAGGFALVLGDPVGPTGEIESTVRGFSAFCGENDWGCAYYQTLPDFLPTYEHCGLSRLKLGEDATVDLQAFTLEGKQRKALREAVHKVERQGIEVRRYDPPISDTLLAELESVSDDWVRIPGRRERQFTLGRFEQEYIRKSLVLVAADRNGTVQGFVNAIPSYRKGEATIDLMRRRTSAPNGVMDYLLVKTMTSNWKRCCARHASCDGPGWHWRSWSIF